MYHVESVIKTTIQISYRQKLGKREFTYSCHIKMSSSNMGIGQIRRHIGGKQLTECYVVLAVILINDTYVANL